MRGISALFLGLARAEITYQTTEKYTAQFLCEPDARRPRFDSASAPFLQRRDAGRRLLFMRTEKKTF